MAAPHKPDRMINAWLITEYERMRKLLGSALNVHPSFKLRGHALSPIEAFLIRTEPADVVFVDAHEMPIPTFEAASREMIPSGQGSTGAPLIVLIGGKDYPAANAFDIGAVEYIDYAANQARIYVALDRVRERLLASR